MLTIALAGISVSKMIHMYQAKIFWPSCYFLTPLERVDFWRHTCIKRKICDGLEKDLVEVRWFTQKQQIILSLVHIYHTQIILAYTNPWRTGFLLKHVSRGKSIWQPTLIHDKKSVEITCFSVHFPPSVVSTLYYIRKQCRVVSSQRKLQRLKCMCQGLWSAVQN